MNTPLGPAEGAAIRGSLVDVGPVRRLVTGAFWIAVTAALVRADTLAAFVLIYSVPVIVLYHVSVMLEFASEHAWLVPRARNHPASWGRGRLHRGLGHVLDGLKELRHAS